MENQPRKLDWMVRKYRSGVCELCGTDKGVCLWGVLMVDPDDGTTGEVERELRQRCNGLITPT